MKIMSYLCRAERQVRVKAYASSLDLNLNAPLRGIQVCRTGKPGLCVSSSDDCAVFRQQKQYGFFACVYGFSTPQHEVSTVSANKEKKCLVKSGKVILLKKAFVSGTGVAVRPMRRAVLKYSNTFFQLP